MKHSDLPGNIRRFELLAYAGLALPWAVAPFNPRFHESIAKFGTGPATIGALLTGLWALAVWGIARRRKNWLRWVWTCLLALGVLALPQVVREFFSYPLNGVLTVTNFLLNATGCYLLFTGDAVLWFRPERDAIRLDTFD